LDFRCPAFWWLQPDPPFSYLLPSWGSDFSGFSWTFSRVSWIFSGNFRFPRDFWPIFSGTRSDLIFLGIRNSIFWNLRGFSCSS
jgi:hypothetical protein